MVDIFGYLWLNEGMATTRIANGTTITVTHNQGVEQGTVIGSTNSLPGEVQRYTVRFADGTISTWNSFQVSI